MRFVVYATQANGYNMQYESKWVTFAEGKRKEHV